MVLLVMNTHLESVFLRTVLVQQVLPVYYVKDVIINHDIFLSKIVFYLEYFRCTSAGTFQDIYNCAQGSYFLCDYSSKIK